MPRLKKIAAKVAISMAGTTATTLNSSTSRTCRREPAAPRRRSTQTRTSRPARLASSSRITARLTSTMPTTCPGRVGPSGLPSDSRTKVAMPITRAPMASPSVTPRPSSMSASRRSSGTRGLATPRAIS